MSSSSFLTLSFIAFLFGATSAAAATEQERRADLRDYAREKFSNSTNHCLTFAEVADYAAKAITAQKLGVPEFLEDMRLVIIGNDTFLRRGGQRGEFYMNVKTTSSGFKPELRDDSPQVEHAFAAIYFAKGIGIFSMPGGTTFWGSFVELLQGSYKLQRPSRADSLLYAYGSDIGERLSKNNFSQIKTPIERTLCESK